MGENVADGNAAKKIEDQQENTNEEAEGAKPKDRKPFILTLLVIINTVFLLSVGAGLYYFVGKVQEATQQENVVDKDKDLITPSAKEAKIVAIEPFYVNLSGSEGYKLLKVTMSMEVENAEVQDEISKRQAQVQDIVLVLLSSKTYGEISGENAKRKLKEEIMDTVNSFLTKGKIKKILFTEFMYN